MAVEQMRRGRACNECQGAHSAAIQVLQGCRRATLLAPPCVAAVLGRLFLPLQVLQVCRQADPPFAPPGWAAAPGCSGTRFSVASSRVVTEPGLVKLQLLLQVHSERRGAFTMLPYPAAAPVVSQPPCTAAAFPTGRHPQWPSNSKPSLQTEKTPENAASMNSYILR